MGDGRLKPELQRRLNCEVMGLLGLFSVSGRIEGFGDQFEVFQQFVCGLVTISWGFGRGFVDAVCQDFRHVRSNAAHGRDADKGALFPHIFVTDFASQFSSRGQFMHRDAQ